MMSSEESGGEDGDVIVVRPLPWCSTCVDDFFCIARRQLKAPRHLKPKGKVRYDLLVTLLLVPSQTHMGSLAGDLFLSTEWLCITLSLLSFHGQPTDLYFLPDAYYQHHVVLVNAVYLLLKEVCDSDVMESSELLQYYCFLFAPLNGKCLFTHTCMGMCNG